MSSAFRAGYRCHPIVSLGFQLLLLLACPQRQPAAWAQKFFEGPGVFPIQILRARGFLAEDHHIVTKDHYQIRLTRARNPLMIGNRTGKADKIPILFVHGILESFNVFVSNSFGAKPKDFSNKSLARESLDESIARLADEPSAKSLPLLALNHGHEVWLMSRRGFPGSRTMIGNPITGDIGENAQTSSGPVNAFLGGLLDLSDLPQYPFSFNRRFWNFSLDQQAQYDLPQAVDLVLAKTGRKQLSVVGHSAGGAITLMALSMFPELNTKINSAVLWSEAFSLGHGDIFQLTQAYRPLLERIQSALPPTFITEPFQGWAGVVCNNRLAQMSLCEGLADMILGPSFGQAPLRPEFINSILYSSSSHEVAQLLQCVTKGGRMHRYDYGRRRNLMVHGQERPPAYDLSRITLRRMSFYAAATDFTVSAADVAATQPLLRTPHRNHTIRAPFNHQGYFFHRDTARLVIIPSLREIQEFSELGAE
jgi:pimeloyl-ACP methyl ester carboxylesterase